MMKRLLIALACATFALAAAASSAPAVVAENPWIRLLPAPLPSAGYVVLENHADQSRRVVRVDSAVYQNVALHQTTREGSAPRMRAVDGLDIPAHGKVALEPGGYHLMLSSPIPPPELGERVIVTFHFDDGSELAVAFEARPANSSGTDDAEHGEHAHHH